ncbi:hypothetical protein HQN90_17655 [Paenibacillus alba]|uniref:hypothetical protein n=1 Tax=Paenibacillus alba TaxID=1197127 RepID=UPI001566185A|nr:hypothetical protein [Paenibacillus alba]NQX67950.1 hypothetical protein [Paenibacillus alba]
MAVPLDRLHTLVTDNTNRSDAVVKSTVVATYMIEGTKVKICSDHFVKTEEENEECIKELYRLAWFIIGRARARGVDV